MFRPQLLATTRLNKEFETWPRSSGAKAPSRKKRRRSAQTSAAHADRRGALLRRHRRRAAARRHRVLDQAGATTSASRCRARWKFPPPSPWPSMPRSQRKPYDGVVALGCVIQGETYHFELVSNESARGLMDLSVKPPARHRQRHPHRRHRSAGACPRAPATITRNKGAAAARAALAMVALKRSLAKET